MEVSEVVLESIRHARTWDEKQAEKVEERGRQSGGRRGGYHIEECREKPRPMIWRYGDPKSFRKMPRDWDFLGHESGAAANETSLPHHTSLLPLRAREL